MIDQQAYDNILTLITKQDYQSLREALSKLSEEDRRNVLNTIHIMPDMHNIHKACGMSLLTYAVFSKNTELLNVLLGFNEVDIKNNFFKYTKHNNDETKHEYVINILHYLVLNEDKAIIQIFLKKHINSKNIVDDQGNTILHTAAQNGHADIVKMLLDHGANVNITCNGGHTALHLAAQNDNADVVRILLDKGADINAISNGWTILHFAANNDRTNIVEMLLKKKVDVNTASNNGSTALYIAIQNGHADTVKMLLDHEAGGKCKYNMQ